MSGTSLCYSIAWTPAPGSALARFGAAWFGWCAERAERREQHPPGDVADAARVGCLRAQLAESAEEPLENGASFALDARLARFAARTAPVPIGDLEVVRRPCGLALAPHLPSVALARTMRAASAAFGTPPPPGDFCLPLTGPLGEAEADLVSARLTCLLRPEMRGGHTLSEITLIFYPGAGRRPVVLERYALGADAPRAGMDTEAGALACTGPDVLVAEPLPLEAARRLA